MRTLPGIGTPGIGTPGTGTPGTIVTGRLASPGSHPPERTRRGPTRLSPKGWRTRAVAAVAAGTLLGLAGAVSGGPPPPVVTYSNDQLSVRLVRVPLPEVLAELARTSNAEVRGSPPEPRDVTARFDTLPLLEALERLLGSRSFMLIYGDGDHLRTIELLGSPQAPPPPAALTPSPAATVESPAGGGVAQTLAMLEFHPPVSVGGHLAEAIGDHTTTMRQLLNIAVSQDEPSVRADALRVWLNVFESEPDLHANVAASLPAMDDAALGQMLRGLAGSRAEEIALQIATQARHGELREKASTVLQWLRDRTSDVPPTSGERRKLERAS